MVDSLGAQSEHEPSCWVGDDADDVYRPVRLVLARAGRDRNRRLAARRGQPVASERRAGEGPFHDKAYPFESGAPVFPWIWRQGRWTTGTAATRPGLDGGVACRPVALGLAITLG